MATGKPLPLMNRSDLATSSSAVSGSSPFRIRQALAVVPPMSKVSASSSPAISAYRLPMMAPATGPDSVMRTGKSQAVSTDPSPPFESMMYRGASIPSLARLSRRRVR